MLSTSHSCLRIAGLVALAACTAWPQSPQEHLEHWANLARYHDQNVALGPPAPDETRVVFMGDSITDGWTGKGTIFQNKHYVNRGISGQTTPQMVVRFGPDVLELQPKVVVILAGTNDIAGNTGPTSQEQIEVNLMSMIDMAKSHGIRVVLSSVLPAYDYPWHKGLEPAPKIVALNDWEQEYARRHDIIYLNYYPEMVDDRGGMKADLSVDGVHPNRAGYVIMERLVEKAIAEALASR